MDLLALSIPSTVFHCNLATECKKDGYKKRSAYTLSKKLWLLSM